MRAELKARRDRNEKIYARQITDDGGRLAVAWSLTSERYQQVPAYDHMAIEPDSHNED